MPARAILRIIIVPVGSPVRAALAETVQDDLVVGDLESRRGEFLESLDALVQIEDFAALLAMEVMVMPLVGALVARRLARDLDATDLSLFLKVFQRTVDGGDSEGRDRLDRQTVDIVREQRAVLFFQNGFDRLFLFGGASFDGQANSMVVPRCYFKPSTMAVTLCLIMES